jgi:hypothetical protein
VRQRGIVGACEREHAVWERLMGMARTTEAVATTLRYLLAAAIHADNKGRRKEKVETLFIVVGGKGPVEEQRVCA